MALTVSNGDRRYLVDPNPVGEFPTYRVYLCVEEVTDRRCLFQVGKTVADNGSLDRMAFVLMNLRKKAEEIEKEYKPHRKYEEERLNYDVGFPTVVDTFLFREQGDRRVNVLAFKNVDNPRLLVPLNNIVEKDNARVDCKTSAWVIGKALKILSFAHDNNVQVGKIDMKRMLIVPEAHFVVLFDWTESKTYPDGVPQQLRREEIKNVASAVVTLLGGDAEERRLPHEDVEGFEVYEQHIFELTAGGQNSAFAAHSAFYRMISEQLKWKGIHPFTIYLR